MARRRTCSLTDPAGASPLSDYLHATLTVCWPPLRTIVKDGLLVVPEMETVCD
jgi:hypothetical protein